MGLWNKIKNQLIDVIEWTDNSRDTMVWKFPRHGNEIKNNAQLIVRESQAAVFMSEGQLGDIFQPGRHQLETKNIPVLTSLASWKYGFNSPFKCDIYFVTMRQFTDLKWGTQNPIMLRDPEFGPVRLRAFGSYCTKITDPGKFIKQIVGTDTLFETNEIVGQFRNILTSRFADALGELKIPILDLAAQYNEVGNDLRKKLQPEFDEYGITLTKFLVENISLPPEVEEALDTRSKMGVIGNMNQYTQFQTANALEGMANNPNGGSGMMGMFAGVGMGNIVGGAIKQSTPNNQPAAPAPPPPLPTQSQWFAGVNGQQLGPLDANALQQQIKQGTISRDTLLWKQGMTNWTPASQIPELASMFVAPPPLPPS